MYCPARATLPLIVLGVSAVLALALQPILKHVLRGRSNSHVDLLLARVASFTFLPTFCLGVAVFANGFFDGSAQTEHSLAVAAVEYDATDDHETSVTTSHDASGFGGGEYDFDDQLHAIKLGDRITVSTKPGAFGFVWELGTVRCFTSGGEIDE